MLNIASTLWAEKVHIMRKYDRAAGTMGRGEEYSMNTKTSKDSDNVLEDYALSMQLSTQNT